LDEFEAQTDYIFTIELKYEEILPDEEEEP